MILSKKVKCMISGLLVAAFVLTGCNSAKVVEVEKDVELKQSDSVVSGVLENGMSYYLEKNSEPQNRIQMRLVVKAGSNMEDDDQRGVAHFVEHLAFNGTKNFEKNSIIDFFELAGMNFGADLNAYTSFTETVYILEIPADNQEMLEKAVLILHDWASAVTFEQEEIDKERGVVTEEWRGRRGLGGRITDAIIAFELEGSRYVDRLPIGDMDVIKNVSRERIVDFYNKWYRPELMSVVLVGDVDTDVMKDVVVKTMSDIPASEEKTVSPLYTVPPRKEKALFTMKDVEQPRTIAEFFLQDENYESVHNEATFKRVLASEMIGAIANQRINEITMKPESPWVGANTISMVETKTTSFNGLAFAPKDGMYIEALKTILDELDRFMIFGVTDSELSRIKDAFTSEIEQQWLVHEKTSSGTRINQITSQILNGRTYVSDEDSYNLYKKYISEITVDYINQLAREIFADRGMLYFTLAPESADIPSDEEIMDVWKNYKSEAELESYTDSVPDGELMNRPAAKAKIVRKNKIEELDTTVYELENGLKIITKKTDFEPETIRMSAVSNGGNFLVKDEENPSMRYCANYAIYSGMGGLDFNQLSKAIMSKNINFNFSINSQTDNISGYSSVKDFETLLQIITLEMTQPQFSDDAWEMLMANASQQASAYGVQPENVYYECINNLIYGENIRYKQLSPDMLSMMDKKLAEKVFRERFTNAADWSFIFTGDFDEDTLVDLCCYYLGSIPGDKSKLEAKVYPEFYFPQGKTVDVVKKGIENKGNVRLVFRGELPDAKDNYEIWKDVGLIGQFQNLLDTKLREVIREDKSGSYGVGVAAVINGAEKNRSYEVHIDFGCEPDREQELKEEVIKLLEKLKIEPVDQTSIDKLTETYRRTKEVNLRSNDWWLGALEGILVSDSRPVSFALDSESVPSWVTSKSMQELAVKYLDTENYVCVYLVPEN